MKFIRNNKYVIGFLVILLAICYAGYSYYQSITQVEITVKTAVRPSRYPSSAFRRCVCKGKKHSI